MNASNKNKFETSIKQLLQDHPGYTINISMNPKVDNNVVFVRVRDGETVLTLCRTFKDLIICDSLLFDNIPIGYQELFSPFDYLINEEDKNNV